ncbi:MAG: ABC transporter ATP-binding protein/permease [Myxococcales bacterium]|nr:ABC transporter ATP-binding protein/permease [Myxococcales bacterium]
MEVAEVGASVAGRFEPVAETLRFPPPRADVDRDASRSWLGRLKPVVLAHPILFGSAIVGSIVGMVTSVAAPAVLGFAINDALADGRVEPGLVRGWLLSAVSLVHPEAVHDGGRLPLSAYVGALLALGLVRAGAQAYHRYALYRVAYHIESDLRSIVYGHLTRLSFSFYDRVQSGQIIARANSDIRSVQMFLTFAPMMLLTWLSFGLALSFMLSVHVGLTLSAIVALPGVYFVGISLRRVMFPLSWMTQQRGADLATIVDENIQGVRVVKSFAAEERQIGALARTAYRVFWAACEMVEVRARHAPLMENIARLGPAVVLLYGGHLVMNGTIEGIGTLVTFNTYMIMLQAPFRILGFFMSMSQRAAASATRIFEVLDEPVEVDDAPDAIELPEPEGHIEMKDVRFGYGDGRDVLDGFSLEVNPGETVAVVGRTGCGKSTVARLLARFYDVAEGSVSIDGHDVRAVTMTSLRARVGLALDEPFLFSMSVRDNIAYGRPQASQQDIEQAARAAQAHDFIMELEGGYDAVVGERGYTLSGGQRQRISLARLFLLNPPILVLDDATSAIDVKVESEIHTALSRLLENRTTLVIAHRESTIGLADRVVLMEDGKAVATGTHAELMANEPRYAAVLAHADQPRPSKRPRPGAAMAAMAAMRARMGGGGAPPGMGGGGGPPGMGGDFPGGGPMGGLG